MKTLALPEGQPNTYYVSLYHQNERNLFYAFQDKESAFKCFLSRGGNVGFYDRVVLTENNGMQIADSHEPYISKSAIVTVLAHKSVIF